MDEYVLRVPAPPREREAEAGAWVLERLEEVRKEYVAAFGGEVFKVASAPQSARRAPARPKRIQRTPVEVIEAEVSGRRRRKP